MRRKKLIVLSAMISLLSSTAMFGNVREQPRICIDNELQFYIMPPIDKKPQYVPGEVIVRFKIPLSDFEAAYLLGDIQPKIIGSERRLNGSFVLRFPESVNVERMSQFVEQNPYVESADPNTYSYLLKMIDDFGNKSREMPRRMPDLGQFFEAPEKTDIRHTEKKEEEYQAFVASKSGRVASKKNKRIPLYTGADDKLKKIQSSDPKRIVRSKAKIYSYRDSEGRLVFTNYCRSKRKTNKK